MFCNNKGVYILDWRPIRCTVNTLVWPPYGCGSQNRYQNGLVSGNTDSKTCGLPLRSFNFEPPSPGSPSARRKSEFAASFLEAAASIGCRSAASAAWGAGNAPRTGGALVGGGGGGVGGGGGAGEGFGEFGGGGDLDERGGIGGAWGDTGNLAPNKHAKTWLQATCRRFDPIPLCDPSFAGCGCWFASLRRGRNERRRHEARSPWDQQAARANKNTYAFTLALAQHASIFSCLSKALA